MNHINRKPSTGGSGNKKTRYCRTPSVFQMEATECGAACLAMILAYYGKRVSLDELRIRIGVTRDGSKAGNIMRAAPEYGMEVHGYQRELEDLVRMETPCIIHWNFNHFVVYEGYRRGKYCINDPACGHRTLTLDELDEGYTGVVLTFSPNQDFVRSRGKGPFLQILRDRMKGHVNGVLAILLTGILLVFPGFLSAGMSRAFVDEILISNHYALLRPLILLAVMSLVFRIFFMSVRNRIMLRQKNKIALISNQRFFVHLFRLPMSFFAQRLSGDLALRLENNDRISDLIGGDLAEIAVSCFESLLYLVILTVYSPVLTGVAVVGFVLDLMLVINASRRMQEISLNGNISVGALQGLVLQGLSAVDTLKASGAENQFLAKILGRYARVALSEQKMKRTQQVLDAFPQAMMALLNVLLLMIGSILVVHGRISVGALVAFVTVFTYFLTPANTMISFFTQFQTVKTDLLRVQDILSAPEEEKYSEKPETTQGRLKGHVEIRGLSFGYGPLSQPAVSDFSMDVQPGKSVAVIGASGCGKSTVARLVCGLFTPSEGEILIDGIPLRNLSSETRQMNISMVSQDFTLFSSSIRDNITLWNDRIPDADVLAAARDACIHMDVTAMPDAYGHVLDEDGSDLSGGQRQRLEIARSLVLNPSVLILDEATSALDPINEEEVMKNIRARGCTLIVIAHRLSAVRDCDEIVVMDHGRIAERGNHDSLMADPESLYRKLIQMD